MTSAPEVPLILELETIYACVLLLIDLDCWIDDTEQVTSLIAEKMRDLKKARRIILDTNTIKIIIRNILCKLSVMTVKSSNHHRLSFQIAGLFTFDKPYIIDHIPDIDLGFGVGQSLKSCRRCLIHPTIGKISSSSQILEAQGIDAKSEGYQDFPNGSTPVYYLDFEARKLFRLRLFYGANLTWIAFQ